MTEKTGEEVKKTGEEVKKTGEESPQYTDTQGQFLALLKKYPVTRPETVVDYVSSQGETVLELPEKLAVALRECEITPVRRRQILKHWFADKGVEVPQDILERVATPSDKKRADEEKAKVAEEEKDKYTVDEDTGAIKTASSGEKALTWAEAEKLSKAVKKEIAERTKSRGVTYVYDPETSIVRMTREGESGGTLEQAKELKRMAEEGKGKGEEESPFVTDGEGNWSLNPKAKVTGLEVMALETLKKAQARGETLDPVDALRVAAEKVNSVRAALGGTSQQTPEWLSDPVKFFQTMRQLSGEGEDSTLKQQIASLERTLAELREEKYKGQIDEQKRLIGQLVETVNNLKDQVSSLNKPTGRTEMDILHEIATEGIGVLKNELPGFRRDIKDALGPARLPPIKSPEEQKVITEEVRAAVRKDKDIEEIGRRLFFITS